MLDEDGVRRRVAVAEFMLETIETFAYIEPVITTLSYAVRISTWGEHPLGTQQIADMIGLDRHATRRGLQRLESMGWIMSTSEGWVARPRSTRASPTPNRWAKRVSILRRAQARLNGLPLPPVKAGPPNQQEYMVFSQAFVDIMKLATGPSPTRFDDTYILAACAVSSHGRVPLGMNKISIACRLPRSSVARRLQQLIARGWVEQRGNAYFAAPAMDASPLRVERLALRVEAIRRANERLDALTAGQTKTPQA